MSRFESPRGIRRVRRRRPAADGRLRRQHSAHAGDGDHAALLRARCHRATAARPCRRSRSTSAPPVGPTSVDAAGRSCGGRSRPVAKNINEHDGGRSPLRRPARSRSTSAEMFRWRFVGTVTTTMTLATGPVGIASPSMRIGIVQLPFHPRRHLQVPLLAPPGADDADDRGALGLKSTGFARPIRGACCPAGSCFRISLSSRPSRSRRSSAPRSCRRPCARRGLPL